MGYRYLEGITAEAGFEAWGNTKEEMLESAVEAVAYLMGRCNSVDETRRIEIECRDDVLCLFDLVNELIYLKDAEGIIAGRADIQLEKGRLVAEIHGCRLEDAEPGADIKSCTLHRMKIWKNEKWHCTVVVDI